MTRKIRLILVLILVFTLSACAGKSDSEANVAVIVALTQTAAAQAAATAAQPTPQPAASVMVPQPGATRIELKPESTSDWYTNGDLPAGASEHFVLGGKRGKQTTVYLSTNPVSDNNNLLASLVVIGADGKPFTTSPALYWSLVLPSDQDYFIEVRSISPQDISYQIVVNQSETLIDPALGEMYAPVSSVVCEEIKTMAAQALGVEFNLQTPSPFLDAIAGEAGQGCSIGAFGNGSEFSNPPDVINTLLNSVGQGWTLQPNYSADGPTGSMIGLTRDMGLMLISVTWQPDMGVQCPADRPITDCNLAPEQKNYKISLQIAQYQPGFSLDGHWEDVSTGFVLDLSQDWKTIYGQHSIVAQGGNKIDALDASINGNLQGKTATVQFQSSFASEPGTAKITYVDVNTLQWEIINPPQGEYYLPAKATLTRK
ncbi:MAG: hypothetical protein LWX83_00945 [Anaerolineae bacterium]|nr:hypothetical protein [Anaerolineae bacterium]